MMRHEELKLAEPGGGRTMIVAVISNEFQCMYCICSLRRNDSGPKGFYRPVNKIHTVYYR